MSLTPLAFLLEGLTTVCLIGTGILWAVFGFLFFAERSMNQKNQQQKQ